MVDFSKKMTYEEYKKEVSQTLESDFNYKGERLARAINNCEGVIKKRYKRYCQLIDNGSDHLERDIKHNISTLVYNIFMWE